MRRGVAARDRHARNSMQRRTAVPPPVVLSTCCLPTSLKLGLLLLLSSLQFIANPNLPAGDDPEGNACGEEPQRCPALAAQQEQPVAGRPMQLTPTLRGVACCMHWGWGGL